jgi:hypothetical protein
MANASDALRKLTSGQTLTNEERKLLGMSPAPTSNFTYGSGNPMFGATTPTPAPAATPTTVTSSRSGITAEVGTKLGDVLTAQNADRAARDAAFANKPTEDPGPGNRWVWQERNRTWARVNFSNGGGFGGSTSGTGGTGSTGGAQTFTWTDPDTGAVRTFNSQAELSAFVSTWSTKKTTDLAAAQQAATDKAKAEAVVAQRRTAQQEFRATLAEFGLGDLADAVDELIRNDYTVSQIKFELPKTNAYKLRFPGMEALRAAGQAVSEATYISMEKGYLQTLAAYGLEPEVLGTRKELGTYIANLVSPREFEERVNLAATRVKDNPDVVKQFKTFYPEVDNNALTAYLLNPTKGMDVIKKQVRLAEIGAAGLAAGFKSAVSMPVAEELRGAVGEQDYQTIQQSFEQAKLLSDQQSRLARIEGQQYSDLEAIRGVVGRDIENQLASQKRAEREIVTRFGGRSGVTSTSLRSTELV